jgi:V/A-type H+-transporting ATPase subunit I
VLVPMARVEIIGPKNRFFEVVTLLHEQGTLHIEDLTKKIGSGEMPVEQMAVAIGQAGERERMEDLLIRVRAIIKALHLPGTTLDEVTRQKEYLKLWKLTSSELSDEVVKVIDEVEERTAALAQSQSEIENEISLLGRYEPILHKIQPLARQIVTTGAFDSVALLIERRYKGLLEQLKEELDTITHKQCDIVSTDVDEETTAAIVVFSRTYSEPVHKFLAMENVNQIRLPNDMQGLPFDQAYESIRERRKTLPEDLKAIRLELETMSAKWLLRLTTIRDVLTDKIDEIAAIPKFGQTEYAFVITGWLPAVDLAVLEKEIQASFGMDVIVNRKEITEKDMEETPVALDNPDAMKPFQFILSQRGLPRYGTLDPTWSLFLFFPVFFGMIVGDIGYGLLYLVLILWLRSKFKDNDGIQTATAILGPAATMCIVFGIFYGEFFGNVLGKGMLNWIIQIPANAAPLYLPFTLPFNRELLYMEFMYIALAVGVIQIMLGLVLGVINAIRTKNLHHLQMRGGILTLLVGVGIAVVFAVVGKNWGTIGTVGQFGFAAIAFAGFIFAVKGGGVMGVVETIETVSHIASYIRIMAVGLGGAIFASAINGIVVSMSKGGGGGIIAGIVLGVVLHTLNVLISAFSPAIHAMRLNFLEFFGKFFEAGNTQYSPFRKTGGEGQA